MYETTALPQRLASKIVVDDSTGCWEWTASKFRGYGMSSIDGRTTGAHRVTYTMLVGPIPEGLTIDHLCRNRACVNPDHLEPVTNRENILRGFCPPAENARKTHCENGHEFTLENTRLRPSGRRMCRTCQRVYRARYDRKRRGLTPPEPKEGGASCS